MLKRVKGIAVIHLYDKDGNKITEIAKVEYDEISAILFWAVFAVITLPGLVMLGHYV